jgi:cation diffusion facilitator CzcD-associated flavoprotein CzcO
VSVSVDVVVIGGGQSGLAVGFYLRRTSLSYVILDAHSEPGGAWLHTWRSMRLFSPARFSSLPGWVMEGGPDHYPTRDEALDYLRRYEARYGLELERPVLVTAVRREGAELVVEAVRPERRAPDSTAGHTTLDPAQAPAGTYAATAGWRASTVVSATGTWEQPYLPEYPGRADFRGTQLHSAQYTSSEWFAGLRVLVVGGGNSGAQIQAELSRVAESTWVTLREPHFLPDHVDGRYLFDEATAQWRAQQQGRNAPERPSLGDIVMVAPVREARGRGSLASVRPFVRFTTDGVVWPDGREERIDAVIWCTGFRPALEHLRPLGVIELDGRVLVEGNRSVREPRLWLVGYGNWTGFASATLIAVGRSARSVVQQIAETPLART